MRTKTLLLAAATLVAGFVSAQADTVFSQNVVGYVNCTVTNGRFACLANQLDTGSNTIDNVLSAGAVSSDSQALYWTGTAFKSYSYFNSDDSPDGGIGWYDGAGNPATTNTLNPGVSIFVHNSSGANIALTTVGTVIQGTNTVNIPIVAGLHTYANFDPVGGQSLDAIGFPGTSSADTYLRWTGTAFQSLNFFNSDDSPDGGSGWYDGGGVNQSTNPAAWPKAGEGFFLSHSGSTVIWSNSFSVQ